MTREILSQQIAVMPEGKLKDNLSQINRNYLEADSYDIRFKLEQADKSYSPFHSYEDIRDFEIRITAHLVLATGATHEHCSTVVAMDHLPIIRDYMASQGVMRDWFEDYRIKKAEQVLEMEAVLVTPFVDLSGALKAKAQQETTIATDA